MTTELIRLEHGGGGKLMRLLIENVVIPSFSLKKVEGGIGLLEEDDGAVIPIGDGYLVLTTDSHTVKPIFFPGGDIGRLAISGTINDLAAMGARPIAMTSAIVMEEGFPISQLKQIVNSMNKTLMEVSIPLVAGDTKVVEKGGIDKIVITTAGIGYTHTPVLDSGLKSGDLIIVTGSIGNHEIALLSQREGLKFETKLKSDVAPLWNMVELALKSGKITSMKDPTRGGIAGTLNEMARKSNVNINVWEDMVPVDEEVKGVAEMLGIDIFETTNEGIMVMGVAKDDAEKVLKAVRSTKYGRKAKIIGEVEKGEGIVILETSAGGKRIMEEPVGSPLPRIC
ncbi:MAG: hydrogenase expression/formation protein HypE [archaeon]|nr:hydrogenase expression/formation protein HypE [archaeon]MCP8314309.1 hydrogenase expression/formation protein HypE [archaeon]MCP8318183.1 hydrogenase expression/formation protein HypE [archaeon]MCP8319676.1 hydrogenase expression/formation protein HypE [archaeon]